ncbi:MAG TPA: hypothetical protein VEM32_11520 [Geobacteraceae bacterium]|nr:hypothetical protein [Geobacteraceae bacterium]
MNSDLSVTGGPEGNRPVVWSHFEYGVGSFDPAHPEWVMPCDSHGEAYQVKFPGRKIKRRSVYMSDWEDA